MNTNTTPATAEVTADAAVDAVETVIWRHENGQGIFSGMLKDANEGVAALKLLAAASERVTRAFDAPESLPAYSELAAAVRGLDVALAACRAVGGAR